MKELEISGVTELDDSTLMNTNGGVIWFILAEIAVGLLIDEWESTKQAAIDAWNGEYNPPD